MRRGSKYYCRLRKAEEAMLAAVSTYNNPLITFKTETCVSLIITAWTYMLQGYCYENGIEIRVREGGTKRVRYLKSSDDGTYITVPFPDLVSRCDAILSTGMKNNLAFINGIRRGIHHSVDNSIDGFAAPKIQANILNFNSVIRELSDGKIDVAAKLPLALQFAEMTFNQASQLITENQLDRQLQSFILKFEHELTDLWHGVANSRNESAGYGKTVAKQWYWYEKWIDEQVRPFCQRGYTL